MSTSIQAQDLNEQREQLRKAAEPLIKYLAENHHPHTMAIVTSTGVQVFEGVLSVQDVNDFLVDTDFEPHTPATE